MVCSDLVSKIEVTNVQGEYSMALIAGMCWIAMECNRHSSLPLPSFNEGVSMMPTHELDGSTEVDCTALAGI